MDTHARPFISTWAFTCGAIIALSGIFNIIVDPYRVLGWNSLKAAPDNDRQLKAYDVMHAAPHTLLLGGSRVELGIDARYSAWPTSFRPVYNLGLLGAGQYLRYRYLQHVLAVQHIDLLVIGLDFDSVLDSLQEAAPTELEVEPRLMVNRDGSTNLGRRKAYTQDLVRSLSLSELVDSVTTVAANLRGDSGGYVSGDLLFSRSVRRDLYTAGALLVFAATDIGQIEQIHRLPRYTDANIDRVILELREMLNLCTSHVTRVILIINPVHADYLEIWDGAGLWPAFENWKRRLTALTYEYSQAQAQSRISLWDFSGYHSYATEVVRPDSRLLEGYSDPSHYTWTVGNLMIRQIFGKDGADMGTELTPKNIDAHIALLRKEQQEYRNRQPLDVQRVRLLYEGVNSFEKADMGRH